MKEIRDHLKDISEIRGLMENSTKFLSLSGLSGVISGVIALAGVAVAVWQIGPDFLGENVWLSWPEMRFLAADAVVVLVLALFFSAFFSMRMARKKGLPFWSKSALNMLVNLALPIVAGAVMCLIYLKREEWHYLPGCMLMFYGLGLLNAGKYTVREVKYFGAAQVLLGLIASARPEWAVEMWCLGFGVLHIACGGWLYYKYER